MFKQQKVLPPSAIVSRISRELYDSMLLANEYSELRLFPTGRRAHMFPSDCLVSEPWKVFRGVGFMLQILKPVERVSANH